MAEPVRARRLTDEEGRRLQQIVRRGKHGSIRVRRALRLAPPIRQQAAHIQLTGRPLILARQPAGHLRSEGHQPRPDLRDLLRGHPGRRPE